MIEGFKLTALKLKRTLKVSVSLPEDYNYNGSHYPLLLCLDGQDFFNFILEDTLKIDMPELLKANNNSFIAIGLQSPKIPEWRISELNPYYNGNVEIVDKSLAGIYAEYIANELIPLLKGKYRITDIYILGAHEAAIQALNLLYKYDSFKGGYILSPSLENCNMIDLQNDIKNNYHIDKNCYLYLGGANIDTTALNSFMSIYTTLDSLKSENITLVYEEARGNDYCDIEQEIKNILADKSH